MRPTVGRIWLAFSVKTVAVPVLLLAVLLGLSSQASAQVYVGGVQTQILNSSQISGPVGVASDPSGNLYIVEHGATGSTYEGQLYKYNPVTKTGSVVYGSPTGSPLNGPQQLASDASGNLYMADQNNERIVVFSTSGGGVSLTATYPMGSDPFAVALDHNNNIWAGGHNGMVYKIPAGSLSGTAATAYATGLGGSDVIEGIAFDSNDNLYVSDNTLGAEAVYEFTASSSYSDSLRTTLLSGLNGPSGIFFDPSGNLLLAVIGDNTVYRYLAPSFTTPIELTPGVTGTEGIGIDHAGNIYITAYGGNTVTEIGTATGNFGQVSVGSSQTLPVNFSVAAGQVISAFKVVDQGTTSLEFNEQSSDLNVNLCPTGSTAYGTTTACAINVTFTPQYPGLRTGAVEVLDGGGHVVATATINGTGVAPQVALTPGTITTAAGNGTPGYTGDSGVPTSAQLNQPGAVATDSAGNLYIVDSSNNVVRKVTASTGNITTVAGNGTASYSGDGGAATSAQLNDPTSVAVDSAGNLYIADSKNNVVREVSAATGYIITRRRQRNRRLQRRHRSRHQRRALPAQRCSRGRRRQPLYRG